MLFPKVVHAMPLDASLIVKFKNGDEVSVLPKGAYDIQDKAIYIRSDIEGLEFLITLIHEFIEHLANITGLWQLHNLIHYMENR
jgi:hypothetical protein